MLLTDGEEIKRNRTTSTSVVIPTVVETEVDEQLYKSPEQIEIDFSSPPKISSSHSIAVAIPKKRSTSTPIPIQKNYLRTSADILPPQVNLQFQLGL